MNNEWCNFYAYLIGITNLFKLVSCPRFLVHIRMILHTNQINTKIMPSKIVCIEIMCIWFCIDKKIILNELIL